MNAKQLLPLALVCLTAFAGCKTNSPTASRPSAAHHQKSTYVIVHGAWGGGWDWKHVADLLAAQSNTVYRPTLSGMGEHYNTTSTNIDLDTHIQDIVNIILWEKLHNVILVGHSYGGMVITGVADRIPGRIKRLVYIDALLPENGESAEVIRPPRIGLDFQDGLIIPTWVTNNTPPPHDVPQSAETFTEPITLTNQAVAGKLPATYILCVEKGRTPDQADFYRFYQRAKARGWTTETITSNHIVERTHPRQIARLLEQAP